jgi:hypothetical protein
VANCLQRLTDCRQRRKKETELKVSKIIKYGESDLLFSGLGIRRGSGRSASRQGRQTEKMRARNVGNPVLEGLLQILCVELAQEWIEETKSILANVSFPRKAEYLQLLLDGI